MKKQGKLIALGFLLAGLFVSAAPARAQNEEGRIKALEQRLLQLDEQQIEMKKEATAALRELSQLKEQEIEMKKEATEAAAALPTFSYRPGSGMLIEAADKSWSFRTSMEAHFRLLFESGLSEAGRETSGILGRRFRPWFYYCVNDCLYEIETALKLDGFGTGNAKNSTGTRSSAPLASALGAFPPLLLGLPRSLFGSADTFLCTFSASSCHPSTAKTGGLCETTKHWKEIPGVANEL